VRIIAGSAGGRHIRVPPGKEVRPTTDRVREALFSHLGSRVSTARILDLFAGSGALGLESLSRGARSAVFVERSRTAARILEANVRQLGFDGQSRILVQDALRFLETHVPTAPFTLIFLDPPYDTPLWASLLRVLAQRPLLDPEGVVVTEHPSHRPFPVPEHFDVIRSRNYGTTATTTLQWTGLQPERNTT
jgi:16S rRNA (guanine966-N2)-methyltransferase